MQIYYVATRVSIIKFRPSIDYAKHKESILEAVNNLKMATVMCGIIKVNYKLTGWYQQGLIADYGQDY